MQKYGNDKKVYIRGVEKNLKLKEKFNREEIWAYLGFPDK